MLGDVLRVKGKLKMATSIELYVVAKPSFFCKDRPRPLSTSPSQL